MKLAQGFSGIDPPAPIDLFRNQFKKTPHNPMNAAIIERMSERLRKTLADTRTQLKGRYPELLLTIDCMVCIYRKIKNGVEGLHDPDNSGDRFALALTSISEESKE